ncbi:glycosyltransferase family 39 protein [Micromonospora sp. RV43]|uniref:glycosyltransferase family 39 protein n=1 Tax=Micromonospora sp. RV43 TaxID=1661387 RepID=UPI001F323014|nr:glycosyltransferase family 39 protein [Micromonospora sp. RV43]
MTTEEPSRPAPAPPTGPATADRVRPGYVRRLRDAARDAAPALALYAVIRLIGVLVVYLWARNIDVSPVERLTRADGNWYLGIVQHGYDGYEKTQSNMAFFPLYPGLTAALERLSPFSPRESALVVAWLAALAAAWGLYAIGKHLHDRRTGILLAALWGAVPHAVVESMGYSESLFTALAAWTLYALLRRHWMTAGVVCLFAGLTRPTASSLIPVVGLAALLAVVRRRDGWRPWAALLLAPAGWLGYLAWVGTRTGRPDGWFHIQSAGWGHHLRLRRLHRRPGPAGAGAGGRVAAARGHRGGAAVDHVLRVERDRPAAVAVAALQRPDARHHARRGRLLPLQGAVPAAGVPAAAAGRRGPGPGRMGPGRHGAGHARGALRLLRRLSAADLDEVAVTGQRVNGRTSHTQTSSTRSPGP